LDTAANVADSTRSSCPSALIVNDKTAVEMSLREDAASASPPRPHSHLQQAVAPPTPPSSSSPPRQQRSRATTADMAALIGRGCHLQGQLRPLTVFGIPLSSAVNLFYEPPHKLRKDSMFWAEMYVISILIISLQCSLLSMAYQLVLLTSAFMILAWIFLEVNDILWKEISWAQIS
jgi:hypothetical protein